MTTIEPKTTTNQDFHRSHVTRDNLERNEPLKSSPKKDINKKDDSFPFQKKLSVSKT